MFGLQRHSRHFQVSSGLHRLALPWVVGLERWLSGLQYPFGARCRVERFFMRMELVLVLFWRIHLGTDVCAVVSVGSSGGHRFGIWVWAGSLLRGRVMTNELHLGGQAWFIDTRGLFLLWERGFYVDETMVWSCGFSCVWFLCRECHDFANARHGIRLFLLVSTFGFCFRWA